MARNEELLLRYRIESSRNFLFFFFNEKNSNSDFIHIENDV